jgi:RND family efflux transporter MFP subunit
MKRIYLVIILILAVGLSACAPNAAPTAIPTVVLNSNPSSSTNGGVTASGVIAPEPHATLGFPLTGTVKTVEVESGDKVTKGQTLVALDTTLWEARVREAQAALSAAQANEKFLVRNGQDQEHIDAASADVERAQASVDSATATLGQATLKAPFDGTIAAVDTSPAETVTPGQEVIMLGDLSNFRVETTDLSERDAPLVQPGQKATISVAALDQDFPGTVASISPISSTVGGDVVYKVTIRFDTQTRGLLWGMTVDVAIETR